MKRIHWLTFYVPPRAGDRDLKLHMLRDGESFIYLREAIARAGVDARFERLLRNVEECPSGDDLRADDILVATTRFPLDDDGTRAVKGGNNSLEQKLGIPRNSQGTGAACRIFTKLTRTRWFLQPEFGRMLAAASQRRSQAEASQHRCNEEADAPKAKNVLKHYDDMQFANERGARILQYRETKAPAEEFKTAAAFLNIPHAWENGPQLIWSFALSGESGLIWNKIICESFLEFFKRPTFAIAEFDFPKDLLLKVKDKDGERGPGTLDFATQASLGLKLIVDQALSDKDLRSIFGHA